MECCRGRSKKEAEEARHAWSAAAGDEEDEGWSAHDACTRRLRALLQESCGDECFCLASHC
jgi:hypothetical protein